MGILLAASAILLADSLAKYARGEGSLWMVGLNLLGVIPGGRLITSLGKLAGLTRIGTRALAAGSRGLAAARASLTSMAAGLRNGLGRTVLRLGDETGSASLDLLTGGLTSSGKRGAIDPHYLRTRAEALQRSKERLGGRAPINGKTRAGTVWHPSSPELRAKYPEAVRYNTTDSRTSFPARLTR